MRNTLALTRAAALLCAAAALGCYGSLIDFGGGGGRKVPPKIARNTSSPTIVYTISIDIARRDGQSPEGNIIQFLFDFGSTHGGEIEVGRCIVRNHTCTLTVTLPTAQNGQYLLSYLQVGLPRSSAVGLLIQQVKATEASRPAEPPPVPPAPPRKRPSKP